MEARFDIYKVPHKAQRRALYLISVALGRLNFGDAAAASALSARIHQLIAHLRDHSASEDLHIGALMQKIGPTPQKLEDGHHAVEALMKGVEDALATGALARNEHAFYRLFNRMAATYVLHIEDEEALQQSVLWPNYRDDELIEAQARFVSQRSPMANMSDLAFILPSLNADEIVEFLSSIRRAVPGEPFGMVKAVAQRTLEAAVWSAVESRLANW